MYPRREAWIRARSACRDERDVCDVNALGNVEWHIGERGDHVRFDQERRASCLASNETHDALGAHELAHGRRRPEEVGVPLRDAGRTAV